MPEEIIVRKIVVDTSEAVEGMEALDESTGQVTESNEQLESQLDNLPGPLGQVKQGIQGLSKAFKALLANPIVAVIAAIVAVLGLLFKAFTKTQGGADKMKDVMAGLSAILEVLTERAAKLFKALGKLFKGDFKGAAQDAKAAVKGVGDEIREATKAAIEYEQAVRRVFQAETDLIVADAERRKQIAQLRFDSRDLTKSIEERIDALDRAAALEKLGLEEAIQLQKDKVALQETEIANTPETLRTREMERALSEANVALLDLETQSMERQKGLMEERNALVLQDQGVKKAAADAEKARQLEEEKAAFEKRKLESDARKEQAELDAQFQADMAADALALEREMAEEQKAIDDEVAANFLANAEAELQAVIDAENEKIAIRQGTMNATNAIMGDGFAALAGFLKEGSKAQRGIQIADATRAAIMGAIQAYQSAAAIPVVGVVLGPIAAAAALAAGMANVKKIASVSGPGGSGGSVPSVSLARPSAGIDARNLVNAEQGIPSQVEITQDSSQRGPVRTYVVESEVTAAQDIERQRQREATL